VQLGGSFQPGGGLPLPGAWPGASGYGSRGTQCCTGFPATERVSVCSGPDRLLWDGLGRWVPPSVPSFIPSFTVC